MYICKYLVLFHVDPRTTDITELDVFVIFSHFLHTVRVYKENQEAENKGCWLYIFIFI